jgi:hypothetical protein
MFGGRIASIQDFSCISLNALDPSAQPRHIFFFAQDLFSLQARFAAGDEFEE